MTSDITMEAAYAAGAFVSIADYRVEQAYQMAMQRAGAGALNGWGIVDGLAVSRHEAGFDVSEGLAIDGRGRLLLLDQPRRIAPPSSPTAHVLTIAYGEMREAGRSGAVGLIVEAPLVAWREAADGHDPSLNLHLASWDGTDIDAGDRRWAGARAGRLAFPTRDPGVSASIVGWSAPHGTGLRIDAAMVAIAAPYASAPARLAVESALGVGALAPGATFDVAASSVARAGRGTLTSFDALVRGSDPAFVDTLHVGDILAATDRNGQAVASPVTAVDVEGGFIVTAQPLNCVASAFTYEEAAIVSIRDRDRPAFTIDRLGQVGFGVAAPAARLHVGGGDLVVLDPDPLVAFDGAGAVATRDGTSRIDFRSAPPGTAFAQVGDIRLLPGRGASKPPVGMALTASGALGIGTLEPAARLDVVGTIAVRQGALVFPDGSVQRTAQVPVPIGAIIDWWQGSAQQQPPPNFQICSGAMVDDPASPFHGTPTPNLAGRFVIGSRDDASAGAVQGADSHAHAFATPRHTHDFPHTHPGVSGETDRAYASAGMAGAPQNNAADRHRHPWTAQVEEASTQTTGANADAGAMAETDSASSLPPYVGLLKLMRIV